MKRWAQQLRMAAIGFGALALAGCQLVPQVGGPSSTGTASLPGPDPVVASLPDEADARHRIALLVPLSGENAGVGNSIANAATMALLDTKSDNLRITTYDTEKGAYDAAVKAIADGNRLILGPLLSSNVALVLAEARRAKVPVVTFSNDQNVVAPDVFVMGQVPAQSIARTIAFARSRGSTRFAAMVPNGEYGRQVEAAMRNAVQSAGAEFVATERYERDAGAITSAARALGQRGGFDSVLIADSARLAITAANELKTASAGPMQLLGTELLSGSGEVTRAPSMRGLWFSAISDSRYRRFSESYRERFSRTPYRISTIGYDSVLLTLRIARDWKPGTAFPKNALRDDDGFLGLDGAFRFASSGVVARAMEVREVRDRQVVIIDPAPSDFSN